jgi:hypothetical protein
MSRPERPAAAFYCVSDARFFPGAVALINSLRMLGHPEPIYLLDCGLADRQRELLEPHVTVVPAPSDTPPYMLKTIAPLKHPADVAILIDVDMIATRPLGELIARASAGRVVAFKNDRDRFVPRWGEILDLGPARRLPYVSVALVFLGGLVGHEVLRLMDDRQARVDFDLTLYGEDHPEYPFRYPEQDVLNAILCTRVEPERVVALEHRLAPTPPFDGLRILDEGALRCSYSDGTEPYALHHFHRKPWLVRLRSNVYSRLLTRLLLAPDVPLRLDPDELPRRLRTGLAASAHRAGLDTVLIVPGVRRRIKERASGPGRRGSARAGGGPR